MNNVLTRKAFKGTMLGGERIDRDVVLWAFGDEPKRKCIRDAARKFEQVFGRRARVAAVHSFPENMGLCVEVKIDGGSVALVECADVPVGFVMVL